MESIPGQSSKLRPRPRFRHGKGVEWTIWGRPGFDVGSEPPGACRGAGFLVNPTANCIVANDNNYALAA